MIVASRAIVAAAVVLDDEELVFGFCCFGLDAETVRFQNGFLLKSALSQMVKLLKRVDGRALGFDLALRLEQGIVGTPDVAYNLLVRLRIGLAAQIFVQSLLRDGKSDSWNLRNRLRGCNRRHDDGTGRGVQVGVFARNRTRSGICAQLARLNGEVQRLQKFRAEQICVEAGIEGGLRFCCDLPLPVDVEFSPLCLAIVGSR
jgi:hypothetical protein